MFDIIICVRVQTEDSLRFDIFSVYSPVRFYLLVLGTLILCESAAATAKFAAFAAKYNILRLVDK